MKKTISISQDLRRSTFAGRYYAFEGIDGSGKTTQVENIKKHLESAGEKVVITSEPQVEGAIQKVIRDALFSKIKISSKAYQYIYSADRAVNHEEVVKPSLKNGDIVLSHRSFWSAIAYGVLDLGEEYDFTRASSILMSQGIFSDYHQFLAPDKTFYLKVSADHAVTRLQDMDKTKDIYESKQKLAKIITGYERVIKEFPNEFIVIDGEQDEEDVTKDIMLQMSNTTNIK